MWIYSDAKPYDLYGIKYSDSTQIIETGVKNGSNIISLYTIGKNLIGLYSNYNCPTVYDVVNRTHRQTNGSLNDAGDNLLIPFADKKGVY